MKVLWICGLPEGVRAVHPVTDVPSAAWSWIVGHLPPPKDVELHILCPVFGMKEKECHFEHDGAHWHCFRLKWFEPIFLRYRFYLGIRKFVKGLNPDVVHGWGGESGCGLLATYCSPNAVVSVQGLLKMLKENALRWKIKIPEQGTVSAWFRCKMEFRTYHRAHRILVESEAARDALVELYGKIIEVVPHPIREAFCKDEEKSYGNLRQFLYVGQMTLRKGCMDVLRAFLALRDKDVRLVMVGAGDQDDKIDAFIKDNGVEGKIQRILSCNADELASLMDKSSAILIPSYGDTGPTVLKEAIAKGLYPICYDNTGAKELVNRYGYGALIDTGDVEALGFAMGSVFSRDGYAVSSQIRNDLDRNAVWLRLEDIYRNSRIPVEIVIQKGSSAAIIQRVTHLIKMCKKMECGTAGKKIVIVSCTGIRQALFAAVRAKICGNTVVREINEWPLSVIWGASKFKQWIDVHVIPKFFDGFICISDILVEFCKKHGRKRSRTIKIRMTVDVDQISKYVTKNIDDYVCYAGCVNEEKDGVDTLRKACQGMDLRIAIGLSHEEALRMMAGARCLVLARPDSLQARAGFPTKLGEYLALGRPVVATMVGEIPCFLKDGVSAYLAEAGNANDIAEKIRMVFSDRDYAESIGKAGRVVAEKFFDYRGMEASLCEWMKSFT